MGDYFCGWYLKCQNSRQTVAFILAYHITGTAKSCSVQVITSDGSWNVSYPFEKYRQADSSVQIDTCHLSKNGFTVDICTPDLTVKGSLVFGPFAPIRYDIMGPFKYVPFMECRHSVFSMRHSVNGTLRINGDIYEFQDGVGYIEGDRGHSFPSEYVWTQCCFPEGSVMLSVANIPFCGLHFNGVISAIHYLGKEYRLATYLGARPVHIQDGKVIIKQGNKQLIVQRLEKKGHPLAAPVDGNMSRTIHETAACKAYFHYQQNGKTIFEFESDQVAFEYEYSQ